ncbi:hypothetical protein ACSTHI_23755, partial [Vibrio parahaemolyticus]
MKTLTRRSSWNWQRYVVEYDGGTLTFPLLMADIDDLVQTIRNHLPQPEPVAAWTGGNSKRVFTYDFPSLLMG